MTDNHPTVTFAELGCTACHMISDVGSTMGQGDYEITVPPLHDLAASDNKLLLPLGGGISKTVRMGRLPMKMDLEIYGYLESPEAFGTDWMMTFRFTPLLPNWFHR